jgi:hypothetical protein
VDLVHLLEMQFAEAAAVAGPLTGVAQSRRIGSGKLQCE